ncbi:hypothetical protein AV540_10890 [Brevibacillus parabrevis]|uniref:ABC transporter transmembrane domain-containing protein n=1 Tax=Brevibacillus parabrevis TaxID=54914 RepID=UPI0007AB7E33|nr:ABC transporter transmembrane domain-containing protein [Brevibacillus parabrevis]KZE52360.1 hypothetical protein AV540_10890 [Brevibacillus parabrevis]
MKSRSHRYRLFSEMLREVFFQAKGQWKFILVAALSILAISVLEFIIPQWTKAVIDQVIPQQQVAALFELGAAIVGAALLLGVFRFVSSFVMTIVSQGAISQLRNKLYQHTVNLDLNFFDRNRTGDLMSRLTSDVNQLQSEGDAPS